MIAEGLTYQEALSLIGKLAQAGIEANITVGGVRISPTDEQVTLTKEICTEASAVISEGGMSTTAGAILIGLAEKTGKKIKV